MVTLMFAMIVWCGSMLMKRALRSKGPPSMATAAISNALIVDKGCHDWKIRIEISCHGNVLWLLDRFIVKAVGLHLNRYFLRGSRERR